eukprot:TRINITY_DN74411_c0_g1_i1.p1 TRINITY_DN74411_c0_g1~~TRINITY_DN74411_c0_g1_i1.p1  ORF type:complete len:112 (+),score=0.27 TRINITY_DN74411_c0_g1_i1:76-411(+)
MFALHPQYIPQWESGYMFADTRQIPPSSLHDTCSLSTHSISQNENSGIRIHLPPSLHDTRSLSIHSMSHNVSGYMLNDTRHTPTFTHHACSGYNSGYVFHLHLMKHIHRPS